MARQPVRKSVRFEVFKRDSFACQYCGAKSPDAVLEVDHITPVANGGTNDILNLVTACRSCNSGKSDRSLSDATAIERRRNQLEELEERRQQLEMLHQWHMSLVDLEGHAVELAGELWFQSTGRAGSSLTDNAAAELRKLIKRYGFDDVCISIKDAAEAASRSSRPQDEACSESFWKIGRFIAVRKAIRNEPHLERLFYIRGILRNRVHLYSSAEWQSLNILKEAYSLGVAVDWMEQTAKSVKSWSDWKWLMQDAIDKCQAEEDEEATDGADTAS